jgi:hypothetical protein
MQSNWVSAKKRKTTQKKGMNQNIKGNIFSTTIVVVLGLLLACTTNAADYYKEPLSAVLHAKLAYMAKRSHVLVIAIDGNDLFGDKVPQRLMPLEGAVQDRYLSITPGKHELKVRVFYQELGGIRERSDISIINFQFQAGRTYYPFAERIPLGKGKVEAVFSIAN